MKRKFVPTKKVKFSDELPSELKPIEVAELNNKFDWSNDFEGQLIKMTPNEQVKTKKYEGRKQKLPENKNETLIVFSPDEEPDL